MPRLFVSSNSPLVSRMVWPERLVAKEMKPPASTGSSTGRVTTARSEPSPESAVVVTTGACNSTAPMSTCEPDRRGKPRWSVVNMPAPESLPRSMAGEPGSGSIVGVGPP